MKLVQLVEVRFERRILDLEALHGLTINITCPPCRVIKPELLYWSCKQQICKKTRKSKKTYLYENCMTELNK